MLYSAPMTTILLPLQHQTTQQSTQLSRRTMWTFSLTHGLFSPANFFRLPNQSKLLHFHLASSLRNQYLLGNFDHSKRSHRSSQISRRRNTITFTSANKHFSQPHNICRGAGVNAVPSDQSPNRNEHPVTIQALGSCLDLVTPIRKYHNDK